MYMKITFLLIIIIVMVVKTERAKQSPLHLQSYQRVNLMRRYHSMHPLPYLTSEYQQYPRSPGKNWAIPPPPKKVPEANPQQEGLVVNSNFETLKSGLLLIISGFLRKANRARI